jgi:hypothetical protein
MTDKENLVTKLEPCTITVKVGGGTLTETKKEQVKIRVILDKHEGSLKLENVLVVPGLGASLMSWGNFDDAGTMLKSSKGKICGRKEGRLLFKAERRGKLYMVKEVDNSDKGTIAVDEDSWHECLGHVGRKAFQGYLQAYGINDSENAEITACNVCARTKQTKKPIRNNQLLVKTNEPW